MCQSSLILRMSSRAHRRRHNLPKWDNAFAFASFDAAASLFLFFLFFCSCFFSLFAQGRIKGGGRTQGKMSRDHKSRNLTWGLSNTVYSKGV